MSKQTLLVELKTHHLQHLGFDPTFDKCPVEAWLKAVALWSVALGTGP